MIKRLLAGGALALMLTMPAAMAQTPTDTPPAPPTSATPAPVDAAPAPPAPADAVPTTPVPADTTPPTVTAPAPANSTPSTAPETAAPPTSTPAPKKSSRFRIGPEVGVFFLTSSKARSQFGNSAVSLGLGLEASRRRQRRGVWHWICKSNIRPRTATTSLSRPLGLLTARR